MLHRAVSIGQFLRWFSNIFDAVCISHLKVVSLGKNRPWLNILLYSHIVCNAFFVLISHYLTYQMITDSIRMNFGRNLSTLFIYINYSESVTNASCQIIAHIEAFVNRYRYQCLINSFEEISDFFYDHLNVTIDFGQYFWRYMWNVWGCTLLTFIFFVVPSVDATRDYCGVILYIYVMLIVRLRVLQINMFINVMNDLHRMMNDVLTTSLLMTNSDAMYNCSYVYSKLGYVSRLISECFGWSMIATCIQSLVDIINSIYWTYINMDVIRSDNFTISKTIWLIIVYMTTTTKKIQIFSILNQVSYAMCCLR